MFSRRISTTIATRSRQYGLKTQSHSFSAAVTHQDEPPPISDLAASYINLEEKYGAHNYHPLPVVLSKGEGMYVFLSIVYYTYQFCLFYQCCCCCCSHLVLVDGRACCYYYAAV